MNNAKCAMAVGAGYLLGRWHKVRWALALAGMVAGKKISTNPRVLVGQLMESSPQLRELAGDVRGGLAEAGKKAVTTAAGNRLESLTDQLRQRTASLRDQNEGRGEESDEEPDEDTRDEEQKQGRSRAARKESRSGTSSRSAGTRKRSSDSSRSESSGSSSGSRKATKSSSSSSSRRGGSSATESKSRPPGRAAAKKSASSSAGRKSTGASARKSTSKSASTREQE